MKLAFVLFHYFPYGGLERDMLAMAQACKARGHEVTIYTQSWDGEKPDNILVHELPVRALTNHGRASNFVKKFQQLMQAQPVDCVVGFNKMPGLDVYYAADVCFAQKVYEERHWLYRLSGRSRSYLALEKSVFGVDSKTRILMISVSQVSVFQHYYKTPEVRFYMLPPGIRKNRVMPNDYPARRQALRGSYGLKSDDFLMLMVGSDFHRKGLKRAIYAIKDLPEHLYSKLHLWVVGKDKAESYIKFAKDLGVENKLSILGARDDVSELMWSADIFLHPAYSENTGTVLLEAMVSGLPVITTDVCGYAHYVEEQQMGAVLNAAQADTNLAAAIAEIAAQDPQQWRIRAQVFTAQADIFSMVEHAVKDIEQTAIKAI